MAQAAFLTFLIQFHSLWHRGKFQFSTKAFSFLAATNVNENLLAKPPPVNWKVYI